MRYCDRSKNPEQMLQRRGYSRVRYLACRERRFRSIAQADLAVRIHGPQDVSRILLRPVGRCPIRVYSTTTGTPGFSIPANLAMSQLARRMHP